MHHTPFLAPAAAFSFALAACLAAQDLRPKLGRVQPADVALAASPAGAGEATLVHRPGASFLQLRFADAELHGGSIEVRSPHDPRPEVLDATRLAACRGMTLLHRGDLVAVTLRAGRGGLPRARIDLVAEGLGGGAPAPLSLCGPDSREASSHRAVARLVITELSGVYYGTAFLVDPLKTLATAGHNVSEADLLSLVAEFNVPDSLAGGTPQPAALSDQYRWEGPAAMRFEYSAAGSDWGVLRVQRNAQTDAWPGAAQGSFLALAEEGPAPSEILRVIGCGNDRGRPTRAFTQQSADGTHVATVGDELRHRIDTEPGSSGAPVLDPGTGRVVGVHVRGGCSAAAHTFNAATRVAQPAFAAARVALAGGTVDARAESLTVPGDAVAGGAIDVRAVVGNPIGGAAPTVRYGFFLSQTGTLDDSARILGPTYAYRPFTVRLGTIEWISQRLAVPADLAPGLWQLGFLVDSQHELIETDEGNNLRWQPIRVAAPAASTRAIEFQHTLGGRSHRTELWPMTGIAMAGNGALSAAGGGTAAFAITAPGLAGQWSLCAWTALSPQPFVPDAFTTLALSSLNSPVFSGWLARLDDRGQAFPRFVLPAGIAPSHPGLHVKAFFVRSDFGAMLGESDSWTLLTLR